MIKAVVVPACTDLNRGDQALVWEAVGVLNKAFGNVEACIVDYGFTAEDRRYQSRQTKAAGFKVVRNIIENPKRILNNYRQGVHLSKMDVMQVSIVACVDFLRHFLLLLFPYKSVSSFLFSGRERSETLESFRGCDLVAVKGGGFLHTYGAIGDFYYLWFGLYHIFLAFRLRKKVIVFPNSIGPIKGSLNRSFVKFVLRKVDLLYLREETSLECLAAMDVPNGKLSLDLGYYASKQSSSLSKAAHLNGGGRTMVGITVRPYRFPQSDDPSIRYANYLEALADFCGKYSGSCHFYFIVQVQGPSAHENDRIAINDVIEKLNCDVQYSVVDGDYNYLDLIDIYAQLDFLVGTRFHSVIFSHLANVPAVAIAYGGNKTRGIMNLIGLGRYVVDIESVSGDELSRLFDAVAENEIGYKESLATFKAVCDNSFAKMVAEVRGVLQ